MIEAIKSNEPLYRALRTFVQTFIGTILSAVTIGGFENLDKKAIISLLASALASGLSAVMNIKKADESAENPNDIGEID